MTASYRSRSRTSFTSRRPATETLETRRLLTGYYPAVADYNGDGVADIAEFRYSTTGGQQVNGRNSLLTQLSNSGAATGYELGYTATDKPVSADFDGDGKADPAVYGFLSNVSYGNEYATAATWTAQPFPNGSGRFAYIPSSGVYPAHTPGHVNGTMGVNTAKVVIVNIGALDALSAVADYDGDGKADFTVYEPNQARFLFIPSSTFDPDTDPSLPGNAPIAVPLGKVGDVPASASFEKAGQANFAVYDAASGTFFVRSLDGGSVTSVRLGGPGDLPVPADFEGTGRADYVVYDPSHGDFLLKPADGSAMRVVTLGRPGDIPVVGRYIGGQINFATFTPATQEFHIRSSSGIVTTSAIANPDAVGIMRSDDYATALHLRYTERTESPNVMFLGDSITYKFPTNGPTAWNGRIASLGVSNNGVNYDTTQNVLWRINNGELATRPKVIVLEVGTNDFIDRTAIQMANTTREILNQIHAKLPGTSVLVMGVFPRAELNASLSPYLQVYHAAINAQLIDLNQHQLPLLAQPFALRDTSRYPTGNYFIDLRSKMSANPTDSTNYYSDPALTLDTVHPNDAGYGVWASAIATPLRLLLHRPVAPGDHDGDGKTDLSVYLPNPGGFATLYSATLAGGFLGYGPGGVGRSLMAPGDYDGDGKTDYAVYGPTDRGFAITDSFTNTSSFVPYGIGANGHTIPTPGDYDGDGKTDLAVYEPLLGAYFVRQSSTGVDFGIPFGGVGLGQSIPAPGDYDGDGKTDLAVYLPAFGGFGVRPSTGGPDVIVPFGIPGPGQSIPVPGDYDGDGATDLAVYLPGYGVLAYRSTSTHLDVIEPFGMSGVGQSIPAPGDYDGDGKTDIAVYMPTIRSFGIRFSKYGIDMITPFGASGPGQSIPVTSSPDVGINGPIVQARPVGSVVASASVSLGSTATKRQAATAAHRQKLRQVAQSTPTGSVAARHAQAHPRRSTVGFPRGGKSAPGRPRLLALSPRVQLG